MVSLLLSLVGRFKEGDFDPRMGWVWLTIIINASVGVAFYSLVRLADTCTMRSKIHDVLAQLRTRGSGLQHASFVRCNIHQTASSDCGTRCQSSTDGYTSLAPF